LNNQRSQNQTEANDKAAARKPVPIKVFITTVGTILIALVVLLPLWNSLRLITQETVVYFMGTYWPTWCIVGCCAAVLLFPLLVQILFLRAGLDVKKSYHILLLMSVVTAALGLGLVVLAAPLTAHTQNVVRDITYNCDSSINTRALQESYMVLHKLRSNPDCAALPTVEDCAGFQSDTYTSFLKTMETDFKCSGFCYNAPVAAKADMGGTAPALLGVSGKFANAVMKQLSQANQTQLTETELMPGQLPVSTPPTLFSQANYDATCDAMAAWTLQYTSGQVAVMYFQEGAALLLATAILGFFKALSDTLSGMRTQYTESSEAYKQHRMGQAQ